MTSSTVSVSIFFWSDFLLVGYRRQRKIFFWSALDMTQGGDGEIHHAERMMQATEKKTRNRVRVNTR